MLMSSTRRRGIAACLLDIDGVLMEDGRALPGAVEAVQFLQQHGIPFCLLSNSTMRPAEAWWKLLVGQGFPVRERQILTPASVAGEVLRERRITRAWWLVQEELCSEFTGFEYDEGSPQAVVVGDIGDRWNYRLLNRVFQRIMDGALLVALHKGRYWKQGGELVLDIGAFVAGLEYAAGSEAVVVGKPARTFFSAAVSRLGVAGEDVVMFGDDLFSDVGGAQAAGLRGGLVMTGKFRPQDVEVGSVRPDFVLESIARLPELLEKTRVGA
ncbi:MAG: TIGR01458 family HAD-type hydrolase [Acidobacteriota bacterium]